MKLLTPKQTQINDAFWSKYVDLVRDVVIPYQYEALHDRIPGAEPSHAVRNFRIAAGRESGTFGGFVFQDSDLAKWLEAVGHSLSSHPDPELERIADELIALIAEAQGEDGYLNTYFTVKEPDKRWTNLTDCHELYCAGHMIEAAVAYYEATGKSTLLDVATKLADCIDSVFGLEEGKIRGYDGHQEIELALVKLYHATGNDKYLQLSSYFIDERGQAPNFFVQEWEQRGRATHWSGVTKSLDAGYHQAHVPVREQDAAIGHSVRAMYMYAAMADLAALTDDQSLHEACARLWNNTVHRQMYITGGVGSTHHGEAFTIDYDLPNDTAYAETCASIGLVFFASRMLKLEANSEYADVMERALYNTVIAGMSQDGKHYFYVNPLEVWPDACRHNPGKRHVKPVRQPWFGCSCCPPNIARLLASLGQYVYGVQGDTLYTHLFIGGETAVHLGGREVRIKQISNMPWGGDLKLTVGLESEAEFAIAVRIPGWSGGRAALSVNGHALEIESIVKNGYAVVRRTWKDGDTIEVSFAMAATFIEARPDVRTNAGKAAIQRGPLVYCLEEADNGTPISSLTLELDAGLTERFDAELLGGCVMLQGSALRDGDEGWNGNLYRPAQLMRERTRFQAVPYFLWGNRGEGEMAVWMRAR